MFFVNLIILLASLIMIGALSAVYYKTRGRAYFLLSFGCLFLILNLIVPFVINLYGYAYTVRWGQNFKLESDNIYYIYCLYALGFSAFFGVCAIFLRKNSGFGIIDSEDMFFYKVLHFWVGVGVIIGFFVYVLGTGMSLVDLLNASRFAWFSTGKLESGVLNLGLYFVSLISVYAYLDVRLGFPNKILSSIVYFLICVMIAISGGRKWVIFFMSGFLAGYFQSKGRIKISLKSVVGILFVMAFVAVWQYGRNLNVDSGNKFSKELYEKSVSGGRLFFRGDVSYFYRAALEAIDLNYNKDVYYPGALALRVILMPLPRSFSFGLKPEGLPAKFAKDIGAYNNARDGNMPPGVVGLFALSFGSLLGAFLFSICMPSLLAFLEIKFGGKVGLLSVAISSHFISAATLFLRGSTGGVYYMIFGLLFVSVVATAMAFVRCAVRHGE